MSTSNLHHSRIRLWLIWALVPRRRWTKERWMNASTRVDGWMDVAKLAPNPMPGAALGVTLGLLLSLVPLLFPPLVAPFPHSFPCILDCSYCVPPLNHSHAQSTLPASSATLARLIPCWGSEMNLVMPRVSGEVWVNCGYFTCDWPGWVQWTWSHGSETSERTHEVLRRWNTVIVPQKITAVSVHSQSTFLNEPHALVDDI